MAANIESYLERDASSGPDWRGELTRRWKALGDKFFVVLPAHPPTLEEILDECAQLVTVWLLIQTRGNFMYAAGLLETKRSTIRRYFTAWRRANPRLIPLPFAIFLRWQEHQERTP